MPRDERLVALRSAVYTGDGKAAVAVLSQDLPDDRLQLAGDGLLLALATGVKTASELARTCAADLRTRGWTGDADLADQLDAALGEGPVPMLRPLPVNLEELADILEGDPVESGGRIDLRTGEVWPQAAIDALEETQEAETDDEDDDHWLDVWGEGSRDGYRDMQAFIATVTDEQQAELLEVALIGRGAFRRFRDVLSRWPDEFTRWHGWSEERQRGRARAWLAAAGYAPAHRPVARPA